MHIPTLVPTGWFSGMFSWKQAGNVITNYLFFKSLYLPWWFIGTSLNIWLNFWCGLSETACSSLVPLIMLIPQTNWEILKEQCNWHKLRRNIFYIKNDKVRAWFSLSKSTQMFIHCKGKWSAMCLNVKVLYDQNSHNKRWSPTQKNNTSHGYLTKWFPLCRNQKKHIFKCILPNVSKTRLSSWEEPNHQLGCEEPLYVESSIQTDDMVPYRMAWGSLA